jgi:hypothetical protein
VTLAGALRTTVTTTTARMQPDATPFFVLPKIPGVPDGTTKIDARLSSLLISIKGAQQGDFQLGGMIYAYLFDGDLLSGKYGLYPGFAYIDATSDKWRFAAGLQQDVFSPMMPTMVDRMSAFAGSGNAGNSFKPQLRVERFFVKGTDRLVIQGAIAGLAGFLFGVKDGYVNPELMSWHLSGAVLIMIILGGLGHLRGALVGGQVGEGVQPAQGVPALLERLHHHLAEGVVRAHLR